MLNSDAMLCLKKALEHWESHSLAAFVLELAAHLPLQCQSPGGVHDLGGDAMQLLGWQGCKEVHHCERVIQVPDCIHKGGVPA